MSLNIILIFILTTIILGTIAGDAKKEDDVDDTEDDSEDETTSTTTRKSIPGEMSDSVVQLVYPRNQHLCGGVLVSNRHILTAATCVAGFEEGWNLTELTVVAGIGENAIIRRVQMFFIHNQYNRESRENNLALLQVKKPLRDKDDLDPPKLCAINKTNSCLVYNIKIIKKGSNDGSMSVSPNEVSQRPANNCSLVIPKTICVGSNRNLSVCAEDYGTPLICESCLVGIFMGPGDACDGMPGVYVDLRRYNDWITETSNFSRRSVHWKSATSRLKSPEQLIGIILLGVLWEVSLNILKKLKILPLK